MDTELAKHSLSFINNIVNGLLVGLGYFILAGGLDKQNIDFFREKLFPSISIEIENA